MADINRSFVNQTGDLAAVTLVTPTVDTDYLVTVYMENVTSPATGQAAVSTFQWTDDIALRSVDVEADSSSATNFKGVVLAIRAKASQAITISATDFGNSQTYNIYVTLTKK